MSPEMVRTLQRKENCPGRESNPKSSAIILQAIHYNDRTVVEHFVLNTLEGETCLWEQMWG